MYNGIVECAEKIMKDYPIQFIIPSGTYIQYARNETNLIEVANQLSADGYHLQEGLPSLVSAYSSVLVFCDLLNINAGLVGNNIRPTDNWLSDKSIPNPQGTSIGVTDENVYTAQKASIMAFKDNFIKWFDDGFTFGYYTAVGNYVTNDGRSTINNLNSTASSVTATFARQFFSDYQMYHKDEDVKITVPAGYRYRLSNSAYPDYKVYSQPDSITRGSNVDTTAPVVITSADFATEAHPYWCITISKVVNSANVTPFPYIQLYKDGFKVEKS
jgi:hypothetical protein